MDEKIKPPFRIWRGVTPLDLSINELPVQNPHYWLGACYIAGICGDDDALNFKAVYVTLEALIKDEEWRFRIKSVKLADKQQILENFKRGIYLLKVPIEISLKENVDVVIPEIFTVKEVKKLKSHVYCRRLWWKLRTELTFKNFLIFCYMLFSSFFWLPLWIYIKSRLFARKVNKFLNKLIGVVRNAKRFIRNFRWRKKDRRVPIRALPGVRDSGSD